VRVGITDYAQDALGDVVYVDLPEVGAQVEAEQPLGEVESTKSVSDVYSPVSGTIVERNPLLEERPELVNRQPYADGWLVTIEMRDPAQFEALLDAAAYQVLLNPAG
jgi:glycine cleavage system H protein